MIRRTIAGVPVIIVAVLLAFGSCKDLGDPVKPALTASLFSVNLAPGGTATIAISGGTPPYRIDQLPNPQLATAAITNLQDGNAQLHIAAAASVPAAGTTNLTIKDSGTDDSPVDGSASGESEIVITITVGASPAVSFSSEIQPIFTNRCVNAGCHPGGGGPFSLQTGQSYAALVGVTATTGGCAGTLQRVRQSFADSSALVRRLEGTTCGPQMPFGLTPIPQSEINLIRTWINQGANNN
jgi:hypothetical protein